MELRNQEEPRITPRYWGYRELSADELLAVGGGNENDGDGGDASAGDGAASSAGEADASLGCNMIGGLVGVAVASRGGLAAGAIAGALATEACERASG